MVRCKFDRGVANCTSLFYSGSMHMQATGANAEPSEVDGLKVMVIDDSNTIRRSAEIFLLQAGMSVILAEDGFDALAKIADHRPDVIFVDIMMPRLDGYLTCALIKKNVKFRPPRWSCSLQKMGF